MGGASDDGVEKTPRGITDPKWGLVGLKGDEKEDASSSGDDAANKITLSTPRVEEDA